MELTEKQKQGLEIAVERYKNKQKYTVISGYAGTGKSTLVKFIIAALPDIDPDKDVIYTSFTGKATQVLQNKGNRNTLTLHKLLYESHPRPDGTFFRRPVPAIPYKIVVVDEISMAPKTLIQQLAKYNVYVICLGDPFQLPPVDKNEDNHLLDHPHIFLDEIMRQEAESEIIQLTMKIRNGEPIENFYGKDVQVISKEELNTGMLQWADQVLVATNATRIALNKQMRELNGKTGDPQDGDKIICCRNYWEDESLGGSALVNGTIGELQNVYSTFEKIPKYIDGKGQSIEIINADFVSEVDEIYPSVNMDKKLIMEGEKTLDFKTEYKLSRNEKTLNLIPYEFTYGYAITCHRAQGSEWDKVVVIEEQFPFSKEEHARWLYTACTRASEKLVLVMAD